MTGAGAATGHVSGNLEKSVAVGNLPAIVFEVGGPTVAEYTPATVDIDGTTGVAGTLTVSEANGLLTGSDLNPLKIVTRSWRLLPSAATVLGTRTYKLTVDFLAGDATGMNTALFEMRRKDSNGTWSTPTAGTYTRTVDVDPVLQPHDVRHRLEPVHRGRGRRRRRPDHFGSDRDPEPHERRPDRHRDGQ